jgi:hypothetical protein
VKFLDQEDHMAKKRTPRRRKVPPVNPKAILQEIASDPEAAPTARVQACKALLALDAAESFPEDDGIDALTARALQMARGRHG